MEHDLVLEGKVVTAGGILETGVGVSDGYIRELGAGLRGAKRIEADGCLIFPGFIDIHVHLREPGWERKEDFRTGSLAAVHGGVTTVVDMPNNPVPADTRGALEAKAKLAREKALVDVKLHGGIPPAKPERVSETSELVSGYKLYLSETTGSKPFPEGDLRYIFELVSATGRPLSIHCEEQAIIDLLRERYGRKPPAELYADARPPEAETAAVNSVLAALKDVSLRVNICHASTGRTVSLVRQAAAAGLDVSCEAALHHLYFSRKALAANPLLRTNPPLRGDDDREELLSGVRNGGVTFLVTDHAPHLEEEKVDEGLAGVPGLDDFSHLVTWLIRTQGVDPAVVARVASSNPARHLRLQDRGDVAPGMAADLAVIDMHSPEVVKRDDVRSRCGWSPYEGKEFPGRARWVFRKGEPLMDDFEQVS